MLVKASTFLAPLMGARCCWLPGAVRQPHPPLTFRAPIRHGPVLSCLVNADIHYLHAWPCLRFPHSSLLFQYTCTRPSIPRLAISCKRCRPVAARSLQTFSGQFADSARLTFACVCDDPHDSRLWIEAQLSPGHLQQYPIERDFQGTRAGPRLTKCHRLYCARF